MGTIEEKATMSDTVEITKNGEAVSTEAPKKVFTFVDNDKGESKEWEINLLSADAVTIINHLQNLQNQMLNLQLQFNDIQAAIQSNRSRLIELLPSDDLASITNFDKDEATEH